MNAHALTPPESAQPEGGDEDFEVLVANNRPAEVSPPEPGAPPVGSAAAAAGGAPGPGADLPASELDAMLAGYLDPAVLQEAVSWLYDYAAKVYEEPHWSLHPAEAREIAEPLALELRGLAEAAPFLGGAADAVGGNRLRLMLAVGIPTTPRLIRHRAIQRARRAEGLAARTQAGRGAAAEPSPAADNHNASRPPLDFQEAMQRAARGASRATED